MSKHFDDEDIEILNLDDDDGFDSHRKPARRSRNKHQWAHKVLIVIVAVLLIGAVAAGVRLALWNQGSESDYDPDNITDEFDVEAEDYLLPITPQMTELQVDDGVNSLLLFGNGYVTKNRGSSKSYAALLEEYTGAKVYDASIANTFIGTKNIDYQDDYKTDLFSLYWLIQCMVLGDYGPAANHAPSFEGDDTVVDTINMLSSLDMSTIDTILIAYDFHDYEEGRVISSVVDDTVPASVSGCLGLSLKALREKFPHIRIIVSSPYFSFVNDGNGNYVSGETQDFGQGFLGDYMIAQKNVAVMYESSFIDNYFGSISVDNYKEYLEGDSYKYPNEKGMELLVKRAAAFVGTAE